MLKFILFLFILLFSSSLLACKISFSIKGEQKTCYAIGDIIKIEVEVDFLQEKCTDNPDKTFVYRKGFKTLKESSWVIDGNKARKTLTLEVVETKKSLLMLTCSRRTTKDYCFEQFKLKMCQ